jgi:ClpP class serine protease
VRPDAFGLTGKKRIAIVREAGAITGGSKPQGGQITAAPLVGKLQALAKRKDVAGIVLRVDSPGARRH